MPTVEGAKCPTHSRFLAVLRSTSASTVTPILDLRKLALVRRARLKFTPLRSVSVKSASLRIVLLKFIPLSFSPCRLALLRFGIGCMKPLCRHSFHALIPCFKISRCSGFAITPSSDEGGDLAVRMGTIDSGGKQVNAFQM